MEDLIDFVLFAPLDEVVEHEQGLLHVELPCAEEPQQVVVVELRVVRDVVILNVLLEHLQRPLLLLTHVTYEATSKKKHVRLHLFSPRE